PRLVRQARRRTRRPQFHPCVPGRRARGRAAARAGKTSRRPDDGNRRRLMPGGKKKAGGFAPSTPTKGGAFGIQYSRRSDQQGAECWVATSPSPPADQTAKSIGF